MLDLTLPELPTDKPRYLMGVGTPDDILKSVARGIDMFDCVYADPLWPPRPGVHTQGKVNIRNARHAEDMRPLDEQSNCPASRDYSRAYPHHLVRANEALGGMLLSWHNLAYYQELMRRASARRSPKAALPISWPRRRRIGQGAIWSRRKRFFPFDSESKEAGIRQLFLL